MTGPIKTIAYAFIPCRRSPTSAAELNRLAAASMQSAAINHAAASGQIVRERTFVDWTTNRRSAFFTRRTFWACLQEAEAKGCAVAVADLSWLLSTVPVAKGPQIGPMLECCPVEIYDVSLASLWSAIPEQRKASMILEAAHNKANHSRLIKIGLKRARPKSIAPAKANARKGTKANTERADQFARRLSSLVSEVVDQSTERISPSRVATALNERGVPSPRGGRWSHNSARNLMDRISRLQASDSQ